MIFERGFLGAFAISVPAAGERRGERQDQAGRATFGGGRGGAGRELAEHNPRHARDASGGAQRDALTEGLSRSRCQSVCFFCPRGASDAFVKARGERAVRK